MKTINDIRGLDDDIFEEYQIYFDKIFLSSFCKNFPCTFQLSNAFTISSNFIKNSIFDCCENDDFFGTKILFRSLIEHYLRFNFVWHNWMTSKSDESSKRYLDFTAAREVLDNIKAEVDQHKLSHHDFKIENWDEVLNKIPSTKNLSKKDIEAETQKYTYKNIIKHLQAFDNEKDTKAFFGSLITEYSRLSSFVHGGSGCHDELITSADEQQRQEEYLRISGLSFQMAGTIKLFCLLMFVQTDKVAFEESYQVIDLIIKKV